MTAPTRGHGLLEGFLARQRARIADRRIPESSRQGRILDIGCGTYPYFLINTAFAEKHGLDQVAGDGELEGVRLKHWEAGLELSLPFDDDFFDAVTMLAVLEHIEPASVPGLLSEVRRVLKPSGVFVLTTPAPWSDRLLRLMARLRLVSPEEIDEHKDVYGPGKTCRLALAAGFTRAEAGVFELGLNVWARAVK